jgi:O-antigen/teichoic acid export membrane protein
MTDTTAIDATVESATPSSAQSTAAKIWSFAVGTAGSTLLGFAVIPLLTWIFAPDEIGRYALLQSFIGLSSLLGPAGFDHYYMRTFHQSDDKRSLLSRCFVSSMAITVGVMVLLTATTLLADGGGFLGHIFSTDDKLTLQLIIFCVAAGVLIRYASLIPRMEGRGFVFSMGQMTPRLVLVIMLVLSFVLHQVTFEFLVLSVLISQVVTLAGLWPFVRGSFSKTVLRPFSAPALPGIVGYTFPIMVTTVIVWVMSFFDRTLLRLLSTFDQLALYSVAASMAAAAGVLQMLFSTLWAPTIFEVVAADDERGKRLTAVGIEMIYLVIGAGFCLAGLLSPLTRLFVPREFDAVSYLVPACLSLPLLYLLGESTVTGAYVVKQTRLLMLAALVAGLTSLGLNSILIEQRGAVGAAVALAISSLVYFVLRTEVSVRTWFRFPRLEMYVGVVSFATLSSLHAVHASDHATAFNIAWITLLAYVVARAVRSTALREAVQNVRGST